MFKIRTFVSALALAVGLAGVGFQIQSVAAAESEAEEVVEFVHRQLNKPYRLGANGMRRFDCSGLVYRAFKENDLLQQIGGNRRANGYFHWFRDHGRITHNPRPGDLVVWAKRGHRVSHIGVFRGYNHNGKAMAVSALSGGVALHKVHAINKPFKAYLRVDIDRR